MPKSTPFATFCLRRPIPDRHQKKTPVCRFACRSRPLPAGFTVAPAERQGRRLPGVARLARSRPRPLRAQRGGEGVCACSGNSNIQRHRGLPRGPRKLEGSEGRSFPRAVPQRGARERERAAPRPLHSPSPITPTPI